MANWSDHEKAILDLHYSSGGAFGCKPFLPGRTRNAIINQAKARGLKCDLTALPRHHVRPWAPRQHCHPLVENLFSKLKEEKMTLKAASDRSGVNVNAIAAWHKKNPSLPNFIAVCNTVGLEVCLKEIKP